MGTTVDEMRSRSDYDSGLSGVGSDYPMYYISWNDCQDFIDKLSDLDPYHTYRLPSEAEWEYACRAGTTTVYYWGNSDSENVMGRYCWYEENSDQSSHPVGTKESNDWGLYDMIGNVEEQCQDAYTSDYDDCPADGSAYIGFSYDCRIARGGSMYGLARMYRSAFRGDSTLGPDKSFKNLGFRLVRFQCE